MVRDEHALHVQFQATAAFALFEVQPAGALFAAVLLLWSVVLVAGGSAVVFLVFRTQFVLFRRLANAMRGIKRVSVSFRSARNPASIIQAPLA